MIPDDVLSSFAKKRILVTGGTGLIGRQVVFLLANAGAYVTSVSLDDVEPQPGVTIVKGDLSDLPFCRQVTGGMDAVFHIAGVKGSVEVTRKKPASFFVPLLMMNTNLLEACRVNRVPRVLYTSSIGAYPPADVFREEDSLSGEPMDAFPGWAKRMAELQIQAYRIQYGLEGFSVVRPCNVYGPGDNFDPENAMVIPSLMARIRAKEDPVVIWGDGTAVRDFAYSRDVAEGMILALHHGTRGKAVNLASGTGVSIRELVDTLRRVVPFTPFFDTARPSGYPKRIMDISLARTLLGYHPGTTLEDGLRETWAWYLAHHDEHLRKVNYFRDDAHG